MGPTLIPDANVSVFNPYESKIDDDKLIDEWPAFEEVAEEPVKE